MKQPVFILALTMFMVGCSSSDSGSTSGERIAASNDSNPFELVSTDELVLSRDPDESVTPDEPDAPLDPDEPITPDEPDAPLNPDEPVIPDEPDAPLNPDEPALLPIDTTGGIFVPSASDLVENTGLYLEDGYATPNVIRVDV